MANSQVVSIRIVPLYLAAIDAKVAEFNLKRKFYLMSRSEWIMLAVCEKLSDQRRPAKSNKKKKVAKEIIADEPNM